MSLMNKVKNFFYEDVEEDEIEETREEIKKEKPKREKKIDFRSFIKKDEEEEIKEELPVQKTNNDLSERELFKSERTFNFPMDLGDEIFDEEEPKELKEESKNIYERKEPPKTISSTRVTDMYKNISKEEPKKEENKHFKPSPVISPVYGILDKNYTVDDVVEKDLNKTKEFSIEKKEVDFDTVRNRAYKELDEEIEKTLTGDIFYNLDDEENKEEENDDFDSNDSVIITYEDDDLTENNEEPNEESKEEIPEESEGELVTPSIEEKEETPIENDENEEDEDDLSPDVKIDVKQKKSKKKEELKEEKEDLFNLIDNMYNEEDEEEEDE